MTVEELLDTLAKRGWEPSEPANTGTAAALLDALDDDRAPLAATFLPEGIAGGGRPTILFTFQGEQQAESLTVDLDVTTVALLRSRLPDAQVAVIGGSLAEEASAGRRGPTLASGLAKLFAETDELEPDARAARLMDWIMEPIGATRCALIPFEAGSPGPPLAFHLHGDRPGALNPKHVPRGIIDAVAQTRQPLVSNDVRGSERQLLPSESVIEQDVRSYMAVPVIFRGELLAVCYVDRLHSPRQFSRDERVSFEAFAYCRVTRAR